MINNLLRIRKQKIHQKLNPPKPVIELCKACKQPLKDGKCFTFVRFLQAACPVAVTGNTKLYREVFERYHADRW